MCAGNSQETKTDLEQVLSLEKECQDQLTATDSDDDRAFRQYGKTILEQQAETESIERKIEVTFSDPSSYSMATQLAWLRSKGRPKPNYHPFFTEGDARCSFTKKNTVLDT